MAAPNDIIAFGFGGWSTVNQVPTLGFGISIAAVYVPVTHWHTIEGPMNRVHTLVGPQIQPHSLEGPSNKTKTLTGSH